MTFSADFVGYARNALERMMGGDADGDLRKRRPGHDLAPRVSGR